MRVRIESMFRRASVQGLAALPLLFAPFAILAGEDLATSAAYGVFRLDHGTAPLAMRTLSETAMLNNWPVTYRKGETVTVVAPDGTASVLVENAEKSGSVAFSPDAGGLWKLENSSGETAVVGVSWSVFGDGFPDASAVGSQFKAHTIGEGPDRAGRARCFPAVSYSGDNWIGTALKAGTLTFLPPEGSGIDPTELPVTGTGATAFDFPCHGVWTVRLEASDGLVKESLVTVNGTFVLSFR